MRIVSNLRSKLHILSLSDRTGSKGENRERKGVRWDMEGWVKVTGQTDRVYLRLTLFTFLALILIMTLLVGGFEC